MFVLLVLWLIWSVLRAFFRWITGEAKREREDEHRQEQERRRQEKERQQEEAAKRQAKADAIKQFDQAVVGGQFPSDEVLVVLTGCDGYFDELHVDAKEALEELLWGTYVPQGTTYAEAVRLIHQWQRKEERARQRAAKAGEGDDDPTRPLTEIDACALLGVSQRCAPAELASAYRRKVSQWHPDRLDSMAQELKDYATRRTARINEAYQLLKCSAAHQRVGDE
jgi:hypothetical protein